MNNGQWPEQSHPHHHHCHLWPYVPAANNSSTDTAAIATMTKELTLDTNFRDINITEQLASLFFLRGIGLVFDSSWELRSRSRVLINLSNLGFQVAWLPFEVVCSNSILLALFVLELLKSSLEYVLSIKQEREEQKLSIWFWKLARGRQRVSTIQDSPYRATGNE